MGVSGRATIPCVVPINGTDSNWVENHEDAAAIAIQAPATLSVGTYSIQVSHDKTIIATYQEGAPLADAELPATGKAAIYLYLAAFKYWRLHTTGTEAAERTFRVTKVAINS